MSILYIQVATMSLQKLTQELYQLFEAGNYEASLKIILPIKIELIQNNLLVPTSAHFDSKDKKNDFKIAQKILEIGALSSLLSNNYRQFENYFAQLRPFYLNPSLLSKKELNSETTKIISLYLLYLLLQGQTLKFHVEMETLYNSSQYNLDEDKFLQFPVNLERYFMEGDYIKVWKLLQDPSNLPCEEYSHFTETLLNALRYEIALSLEKSYSSLPISNCKNLLYFPQELLDAQFEEVLRNKLAIDNWVFQSGKVYFTGDVDEKNQVKGDTSIINNVLTYAEEIELIV